MTNIQETVYYFIPALLVLFGMFFLVKRFTDVQLSMMKKMIDRDMHIKMADERSKRFSESLPLKLQAYERLILFMERISPNSLLVRVHQGNMTAQLLHLELLGNIRAEFEHNLSQQLYVSDDVWEIVCKTKDEIAELVDSAYRHTGPSSTGIQLSTRIFEEIMGMELLPTHAAILSLKTEAQKLLV